jgi:hypothetical protein
MKKYTTQLIIAGVVLVLIILILVSAALSRKAPVTVTSESFKTIETVPTLPPAKGAGVDVQSAPVQNSKVEIEKLQKALPFIKKINVNGEELTIRIPEASLQDYTWSLIVYIPELDFQVPTTAPHYASTKESFKAAAAEVYTWIRDHGVDPEKIIIIWGDDEFSQKRAKEWLQ